VIPISPASAGLYQGSPSAGTGPDMTVRARCVREHLPTTFLPDC